MCKDDGLEVFFTRNGRIDERQYGGAYIKLELLQMLIIR
jgi:hypothetical protein